MEEQNTRSSGKATQIMKRHGNPSRTYKLWWHLCSIMSNLLRPKLKKLEREIMMMVIQQMRSCKSRKTMTDKISSFKCLGSSEVIEPPKCRGSIRTFSKCTTQKYWSITYWRKSSGPTISDINNEQSLNLNLNTLSTLIE